MQYYKKFKKRKYYSSKEEPSGSNFLKKSKTSDNVKYISLPSIPSADEKCVERFLKAIRSGPLYFCVVCNRCLYKSNVVLFDKEKYNINKIREKITDVRSFHNNFYICKTCPIKMKKSQVPCQAVYDKLFVADIPEEISCLNQLELFLICKIFLIKKILIMPKGQTPKLHGAIVNVPVDVNKTYSLLPNSKNIIIVKLKKKIVLRVMCFLRRFALKGFVRH